MRAPLPANEKERLAALYRYAILDTPAEPAFDRLTRTAAHVMGVPIAVISLVDKDRQFFKSCVGFDASETPRDVAFCAHSILVEGPTVVLDARLDARFADNPLVTGPPFIRFYAGVPLRTGDGFQLGTLCGIDLVTHEAPTAEQLSVLQDLAAEVIEQLEFRMARRELSSFTEALKQRSQQLEEEHERFLESELRGALALEVSQMGTFDWDALKGEGVWSAAIDRISGYALKDSRKMRDEWIALIHPDDRARMALGNREERELEQISLRYRIVRAGGEVRWIEQKGIRRHDSEGQLLRAVGVIWDVTDREIAERALLASEEKFRQLSACSPLGVFHADSAGNTTYANARLSEIWDLPGSEFLGTGWMKRVHPADFPPMFAEIKKAHIQRRDVNHKYRLVLSDGTIRWVHARVSMTRGDETGPAVSVGVVEDITEQRLAAQERERLLAERTELLQELDASVRDMGRVQMAMAGSTPGACRVKVDLCFHPKHAAGGDFLCQYRLGDGRDIVLLTDVSGHELKAAFCSAHAQGKVKGMLDCGVSLDGVFERLNGFLLEQAESAEAAYALKPGKWQDAISIAACALVFDEKRAEVLVRMYGTPSPVIIDVAGMPEVLCETGSNPLGWFRELAGATTVRPTKGALVMLWTDGLEDLACALGISPLNAAFALLRCRSKGEVPGWISEAQDDVMVVCARLPGDEDVLERRWLPLLDTQLMAEQSGEIDLLQESWKREIEFAIQQIEKAALFDILLCTREAVLNGLLHGCKYGGAVRLSIQYCSKKEEVRVVVSDPGPGHDFDPDSRANDVFLDGHRGLLLMHAIAKEVRQERNGATVKMNFRVMAQ